MTTRAAIRHGRKAGRRQRGVTLVEVLIAVFVLAVGLLGTAALQLTSKRANLEAKDRAMATMIAKGFIERMRMNPRELATYTDGGVGRVLDGTTMAAVNCSVDCSTAQIATLDLYNLEQELVGAGEQIGGAPVGGISTPRACITGPNGGSGTYTVAIVWRGLTKLSDPVLNTCGQGSGDYDSSDGTETDVYRRILVVDTYIAEPI